MNEEITLPMLIVLAIVLICQSSFLFTNARKYGHNYWFWGIWGLISTPLPLLCYFLFARRIFWPKNKNKSELRE